MVLMDLLAQPDLQVLTELMAQQVQPAVMGHKVRKVYKVLLVLMVQPGPPGQQVPVLPGLQVLMEQME
jgi:hypothetical protein